MKYRLAGWAAAGFLVAGLWALYASGTTAPVMTSSDPMMFFVRLTCPIALLSSYPLSLYLVLVANAITYALVGLTVEALRRQFKHAN